jgi:hypothetical protein
MPGCVSHRKTTPRDHRFELPNTGAFASKHEKAGLDFGDRQVDQCNGRALENDG